MKSHCRFLFLVLATSALSPQFAAAGEVHRELDVGMAEKALALLQKDPTLIGSLDESRQTPLHVAAARGRTAVVKWLLANKADVNAVAYNKFTPLHVTEDGEIAQALIAAGADLNVKDAWGETPLQRAAYDKRQVVVDVILATGYKLDLRTAVMLKKRDEVKKMLKDDPALAKQPTDGSGLWGSTTPLGIASLQGDKELVQLLLDAGAEINEGTFMPNAGGEATALTNAVWKGNKEIVELLLKRGAKTNVVGGKFYRTILDFAREHSDPEIVRLLEKPPK